MNINIQITNVRQEVFVFCLRHLEKNGGDKIPLPFENTGKLNVTKKKRKTVVLHITYSNKFYVFYITTNNFLTTGYLAKASYSGCYFLNNAVKTYDLKL